MPDSEVVDRRPDTPGKPTAGRTLKRIFRQDDSLARVQTQASARSLLMKPLRLSIFMHLCDNPCDHLRSIARAIGANVTSARWSLERMAEAGYLETAAVEAQKIYWPRGMIHREDLEIIHLARSRWPAMILGAVHGAGGHARQRDIKAILGQRQQNVEFWLRKMVSIGILDKSDERPFAVYSISPGFLANIEMYDDRAREFYLIVIELLRADGLHPGKQRLRGSRMAVDLKLPTGTGRIRLECNPLAPARRFLPRGERRF